MTESQIQSQIMKTLKQMGIWAIRINSGKVQVRGAWLHAASEGTADIVVFPRGKLPVWLEVKTPKGKLSREQELFNVKAVVAGHKYFIIRSLDDLAPRLQEMR